MEKNGEHDKHDRRPGDLGHTANSPEDDAPHVRSDRQYHHGPPASWRAWAPDRLEADSWRERESSSGPTWCGR